MNTSSVPGDARKVTKTHVGSRGGNIKPQQSGTGVALAHGQKSLPVEVGRTGVQRMGSQSSHPQH